MLRGSGTGATSLSAFHSALVAAGLGHYNLVRLSSVVPPGTSVDGTGTAPAPTGRWGDRLYCVYAARSATMAGEQAWAGMGWVQRADGQGGLLVEHEGSNEAAVVAAIKASLGDLAAGFSEEFGAPDWVVNGVECTGAPVCSLVIAPYDIDPWAERR